MSYIKFKQKTNYTLNCFWTQAKQNSEQRLAEFILQYTKGWKWELCVCICREKSMIGILYWNLIPIS